MADFGGSFVRENEKIDFLYDFLDYLNSRNMVIAEWMEEWVQTNFTNENLVCGFLNNQGSDDEQLRKIR